MKYAAAIMVMTIAIMPALAQASIAELCIGQRVAEGPDGRMLGHLPYGQASAAELVTIPVGFALGAACQLRPEPAADLARMLTAAQASGLGGYIRAVSCYRTVNRQRSVFCSQIGPNKRYRNAAERARSVGPPGYSEHSTGYALDFGTRPSPGCRDVDACFARTLAGRWLIAHAPDFGFEMSFPAGNAQGVTWEPWHWRWVGTSSAAPGAGPARAIFARARRDFPALPEATPSFAVPPLLAPPGQGGVNAAPKPIMPPAVTPPQMIAAPTVPSVPATSAAPRIEVPPMGSLRQIDQAAIFAATSPMRRP